jgi:hypothetical protein
MIRSVSDNQSQILLDILMLNGLCKFDADITYGNGHFYKVIQEPKLKFDIDPQVSGVTPACSTNLPIPSYSLQSVVFDPPFLTYVRNGRNGNGNMVMSRQYGGYWRYDELEHHYKATLTEVHRILQPKGILVFKCQDIVHNHKLHPTHINIVNWCENTFRLKDMFILSASSRMPVPQQKGVARRVQKHARIFHSYFLVLEKLNGHNKTN